MPTDAPEKALAAAFWNLDHGYLGDALAAFRKAQSSAQTNEMIALVQTLHNLGSSENLLANAQIELPQPPFKPFRPAAWQALEGVRRVVRFAGLARAAVTPARRTMATEETLDALESLRNPAPPLTAEVRYIQQLAELWAADFAAWIESAPPPEPQGAVANPFLFAEPLRTGRMFVGRRRELDALAQAWHGGNLQPVLLHGPHLMGKTSLLFAAERAIPSVELAWFHLAHTDRKRMALPQVLAAIEEAMRQSPALELTHYGSASTQPSAMAAGSDLYVETDRLIRRCCSLLQPANLVLVLDDFDAAAAALDSEGALTLFANFIAHLYQTIRNFSVAFTYEQPPETSEKSPLHRLAGTLRTIALPPLSPADVERLLRPPGFPLYFDDSAVARVFEVSGGKPYLVQLLGHAVVEQFNRAAAQRQGDSYLCAQDVETAIEDASFAERANGQLAQEAAHLVSAQPSLPEDLGRKRLESELQEIMQTKGA